jgi:hypothetical protein
VPPAVFTLIEEYRDRAKSMKPGKDLALLIDDFVAQVHEVLKDAHLREIARISNEHRVEVSSLRRKAQGIVEPPRPMKENLKPQQWKNNDEVMELRSLQDRLDLANSRVRAAETLLATAV